MPFYNDKVHVQMIKCKVNPFQKSSEIWQNAQSCFAFYPPASTVKRELAKFTERTILIPVASCLLKEILPFIMSFCVRTHIFVNNQCILNYFYVLSFLQGCISINDFDNKVLLNQKDAFSRTRFIILKP